MAEKTKLKQLEQNIEDLEKKWKRALADYDNLEKRLNQEKNEFVKYANTCLIIKLLDTLDDLEKAEKYLKDKGLTLALDKLRLILKKEGLKEIKAEKEIFNPEIMDCVELVQGKKNTITAVVQKGYFLNQKVIRPAKVKVGADDKNI